MANFGDCVNWVLRIEDRSMSGRVVNLGDGAGWTRFGITSRNNPQMPMNFFVSTSAAQLMNNTDAVEAAKDAYYDKYWKPIRGGEFPTDELAATLLSFDVNDGAEAVKLLQGAVGVDQDGKMGQGTLGAVLRHNAADLAQALREAQEDYYRDLVVRRPDDIRFLDGWVKRARVIYPNLPS